LRLSGDPAEVVKQMGNSLAQLDKHYASRSDAVTQESAAAYFAIMPESAGTGAETQSLAGRCPV
jgi:uncharacterized membrane-anchored protein YhcB (DUF1043 family)